MVNPTILKLSSDLQLVRDGCMSVDHGQRFAQTKRPKRLLVEWRDPLTWELKRQKFTGLMAACIHHEIDHLDGILFVDRIIVARMNRFTLQ
jgi:peptide deformylase